MGGVQVDGGAQRAFSTSAEAVLCTVNWLNSSEAKTLKSKDRPRLAPPDTSSEPVVASASMPLMRTRVKVELKAAHRDLASLALVARQGDAGNALQRFAKH
jgi:hypothetical protein